MEMMQSLKFGACFVGWCLFGLLVRSFCCGYRNCPLCCNYSIKTNVYQYVSYYECSLC